MPSSEPAAPDDEFGPHAWTRSIFGELLIGGLPGSGKSFVLNNIVAHVAARSLARLSVPTDGETVELASEPEAHNLL